MKVKKLFEKNIIATLLLCCFIFAIFSFTAYQVNRLESDACFETLREATAQAADSLRTRVETDKKQLSIVANILSRKEEWDSDIINRYLSSLRKYETFSAVGLLLPDNRLVMDNGEENTLENVFDYSSELSKIPYVSGVVNMPDGSGEKAFYQAIPVERNGKIAGILYGYTNLADFGHSITLTAFDGKAQIYVADGESGDFLVDTWHEKLGNIWDGDIMNRKVKPGYDYAGMKKDFVEGKSGHIAFLSKTAGEYFYSYYMPVGVNGWMVQLTVPESVVFAEAIYIRRMMYIVAGVEVVLLAVYFLWVLTRVRRETARKNRQLAQSLYMYDVQQTLFDAHKNPNLFTSALRKVSEMLTADRVFFAMVENDNVTEVYTSSGLNTETPADKDKMNQALSQTFLHMEEGQSILLYPEDIRAMKDEKDREELAGRNITNLIMTPVVNSYGKLVGILGGI
ncbi:MAG: cache domain-containing protein, partial [Clostridia bacterium]